MSVCHYPEKVPYTSERAAKLARVWIYKNRRHGGGVLIVYPCGAHWHVGHRKPGRRKDRT